MAKSIQFSFRSTGAVALIALSALAGCATQSSSGQVYREGETRRAQIIEQGTVESVRMVTIQGDTNGVGTAAGGIIGGIAGSNVGGGSGRAVGAIVGAVAGGLEITVRMDNGTLRAYVQDAAGEDFRPGDRVRVVSGGGTSRVTR
jgi:outer membrane lipoprotein SlyB